MSEFHAKAITDPVHGNIWLSKFEAEVASSRAFQRLHNVRQLGLAHLVFPGANYSRYAHSVGACHNAGQMLDALKTNAPGGKQDLTPRKVQALRLAALLHDLGHYPFSHATEHVVDSFYKKGLLNFGDSNNGAQRDPNDNIVQLSPKPVSYNHEALGQVILENDSELEAIFAKNGFTIAEVVEIFTLSQPNPLVPIISSDLDCDRLDYLRRTAYFSGAPYGSVDVRFLIDHATLDQEGRFCFGPKALRAADHLLVSRYYDYMQVPFHKTVAALEWSLVTALEACLERGLIDCSASAVEAGIKSGAWSTFDDQHIVQQFRDLQASIETSTDAADKVLWDHLNGLINRKPPKLVAGWEEISPTSAATSAERVKAVEAALATIAADKGIDRRRLHVWDVKKSLSSVNADQIAQMDEEHAAKAIHILNPRTRKAELLVEHPDAVMRLLSCSQYAGVRVYYLPMDGEDSRSLRVELCGLLEKAAGLATTCTAPRN